jgi:hypothetical protein
MIAFLDLLDELLLGRCGDNALCGRSRMQDHTDALVLLSTVFAPIRLPT